MIEIVNQFFLPMIPPTSTAQQRKVAVVNGKPKFYQPSELKNAKEKFLSALFPHKPDEKLSGAVGLVVKWCFPKGKHKNGEYKTTRPDTDNLQKLFKDCMTQVGFWNDDAQVASEVVEKFHSEIPGIWVQVIKL